MKGIVFTEFIEMMEAEFGPTLADRIITLAGTPTAGAYTAVGTYNHAEMLAMVTALSRESGIPAPELARAFGVFLFKRFVTLYPHFFEGVTNALEMLERIDGAIHLEVRKLYADAELPRVLCDYDSHGNMRLTYRSARPFADLANGLIHGCVEHFGQPVHVRRLDNPSTGDGTWAEFELTPSSASQP